MNQAKKNKRRGKAQIKPQKAMPEPSNSSNQSPAMAADQPLSKQDIQALVKFADYLQRINMAEYIRLTQRPKRLLWLNFVGGIARGFGITVGFSLVSALAIYILNQLNLLNLPLIGDFIAQILQYVELARGVTI